MLWKRARVRELRKDNRNSAAYRISGRKRRRLPHEQHFLAARRNPGRNMGAIEIDIRRAARRVRQQDGWHSVFSGNEGRSHGITILMCEQWILPVARTEMATGWAVREGFRP